MKIFKKLLHWKKPKPPKHHLNSSLATVLSDPSFSPNGGDSSQELQPPSCLSLSFCDSAVWVPPNEPVNKTNKSAIHSVSLDRIDFNSTKTENSPPLSPHINSLKYRSHHSKCSYLDPADVQNCKQNAPIPKAEIRPAHSCTTRNPPSQNSSTSYIQHQRGLGKLSKVASACDPRASVSAQDRISCADVPSKAAQGENHSSLIRFHWFHGEITRNEAEILLLKEGHQTGSFLIRTSKNSSHEFSLSLRVEENVKHYRIFLTDSKRYFITSSPSFQSIASLVKYYSHSGNLATKLTAPCTSPTLQNQSLSTMDAWEIHRSELQIIQKIGKGHFGEVWSGILRGCIPVAVKTFNSCKMTSPEFLAEAKIMKQLRHPRLLQMLAICSTEHPLYIITELMVFGNLQQYCRAGNVKTWSYLIQLALQILSGMVYLESNMFVHRDLAARNILIDKNGEAKIADFGMSKCLAAPPTHTRSHSKFPIKWSAPEVVFRKQYSCSSDVWAFGILLWEMATFGRTPYPGLSNKQVCSELSRGYIMPCPDFCLPEIYAIMKQCWNYDCKQRPTFSSLFHSLETLSRFDWSPSPPLFICPPLHDISDSSL